MSVTAFSYGQLRQLEKTLSWTESTLDMTGALVTERAEVIEIFRDPSLLPEMEDITRWMRIPVIGRTGLIAYLDYAANCMEALKLPGMHRIARLREIDEDMQNLSFVHVAGKMMAPAMARVAEVDLRCRAHIGLARTALAIERYRLVKGELPERLEELVGEYLEGVPIDPFDGKPIKYKRTQPGYVLWSIGEDGEDNGGVERDKEKRDQPWDVTFIVTRRRIRHMLSSRPEQIPTCRDECSGGIWLRQSRQCHAGCMRLTDA